MASEQFIVGTLMVTRYLRERFDKEKIYLLAHSGGTFFELQAAAQAPEMFAAYVGVAQMVHQLSWRITTCSRSSGKPPIAG